MSVKIGEVPTFGEVSFDKERALKPLEEAAEVFGAYQNEDEGCLIYECADVIQATCNLLASVGITDLTPVLEIVRNNNEERGREYER